MLISAVMLVLLVADKKWRLLAIVKCWLLVAIGNDVCHNDRSHNDILSRSSRNTGSESINGKIPISSPPPFRLCSHFPLSFGSCKMHMVAKNTESDWSKVESPSNKRIK